MPAPSTQTVDLAERLTELIRSTGMTKKAVAERAGMRPDILSQVAGGHKPLSPFYAAKLGPVLHVPVGWLLGLEERTGAA